MQIDKIREFLFRGFEPCGGGDSKICVGDNIIQGRWVEGDLFKTCHDGCIAWCIADECLSANDYGEILGYREIVESTVGQYIGLSDRNGRKIFEYDVVRYQHYRDYGQWGEWVQDQPMNVTYDEQFAGFRPLHLFRDTYSYSKGNLEVIGTIFDVPEVRHGVE